MTRYKLIFTLIALTLALTLTACKKEVSEDAKEQAQETEGYYDVEGTLDLSAYAFDDAKTVHFTGKGTARDIGNAAMEISYTSDKTGETNSIMANIDEQGNIIFEDFTISYEGIPCSNKMHSSNIRRHGSDTIAGTAYCTMTAAYILRRDMHFNVTAVRHKKTRTK